MITKIIKTEEDYETALEGIEELMEARPDTPDADELELLATLVELYEDEQYPIDFPDPIEAIKFRMEQTGLKRTDLAPFLGSRSRVSEILNRKRPLSLKMIRALHNDMGIPAEVLLQKPGAKLPKEYGDLEWNKFPVNEMYKRKWFTEFGGTLSEAKEHAEELIRDFLTPLDKEQLDRVFFRKHVRRGSRMNNYSLMAWKAKVLMEAKKKELPRFKPEVFSDEFMSDLTKLSFYDTGPKLAAELLEKSGVAVILERLLPGTHMDGAAMRLPDGRPIIALTLRYDRLDNFWFSLFHEIGHVVLHFKGSEYYCFLDDFDEETSDKREKQADEWAANALIPPDKWATSSVRSNFQPKAVCDFAYQLRFHPAIVAGRIRKELNNYRILSKLVGQRKVRKMFNQA